MSRIDTLWRKAEQHLRDGLVAPAKATLESLLAHDPDQPRVHLVLGGIAWKHDRIREATEHGLAASRCNLTSPEIVCDVIAALVQVGESAAASRLFTHRKLIEGGLAVSILMRLSGQAQINGEHERALEFLERARNSGAEGSDFQCYLGVQLTFNGRLDEAERALESCTQDNPAAGRAGLFLSRLRKQTAEHNHLANLSKGLTTVRRGSEEHAALEFARYKELEDLGSYEEAWQALANANRVVHEIVRHDRASEAAAMARLVECSRGWEACESTIEREGPCPIFIVGMPRSGTTLLDRIMGNHSQVANAGELGDFGWQLRWVVDHRTPAYPDALTLDRLADIDFAVLGRRYLQHTQWRAGGKPFYVDKLPANWVLSGLVARALPNARILHLVRDPMDVCFSNFRAFLGYSYPYAYDLASLAQHYLDYRRVMTHWQRAFPDRIMNVAYSDLVEDPSKVSEQVFAFCGLQFEPGCTDLTRNQGAVATLSMIQVRQSIHRRNFGQWRPYTKWLRPLKDALAGI